jgi:hypothetical protein
MKLLIEDYMKLKILYNMKNINIKVFFVLLLICITQALSAQSMRVDNKIMVRTLGEDSFEMVPAGVVSYKLENGQCFMLFDNVKHESGPIGSYEKTSDKILFFNPAGDQIGYFTPADGRFYRVTASKRRVLKGDSSSIAILFDGVLRRNEANDKTTNFAVDSGFNPVFMGFILFYIIG